jgi:hypothetical protein
MSSFILLMLFVRYELSYDSIFKKTTGFFCLDNPSWTRNLRIQLPWQYIGHSCSNPEGRIPGG